jgi:hypothetical protein
MKCRENTSALVWCDGGTSNITIRVESDGNPSWAYMSPCQARRFARQIVNVAGIAQANKVRAKTRRVPR